MLLIRPDPFVLNGKTEIVAISLVLTPAFNRLTLADRRSLTYIYIQCIFVCLHEHIILK